ncbi:hypothetical protein [Parafrankia sp. EUN1f]|uniref:hypothetical protein n=1 Tax=Parafrankia sp. EUN1f TaxID=102897 RepID=UPI0001C455F7|nr:hypothetical protein [Parafrankia sp. EUN1f]EFC84025.1 hypothetical protein FrEUN1fDRAFT_2873 [Parafrankia sp. EUN1f]
MRIFPCSTLINLGRSIFRVRAKASFGPPTTIPVLFCRRSPFAWTRRADSPMGTLGAAIILCQAAREASAADETDV